MRLLTRSFQRYKYLFFSKILSGICGFLLLTRGYRILPSSLSLEKPTIIFIINVNEHQYIDRIKLTINELISTTSIKTSPMGIIVISRYADYYIPPTTDHKTLKLYLNNINKNLFNKTDQSTTVNDLLKSSPPNSIGIIFSEQDEGVSVLPTIYFSPSNLPLVASSSHYQQLANRISGISSQQHTSLTWHQMIGIGFLLLSL